MAEILKEWLTERLQRPITWESSAFGDMMKNGFVIADVLLSYRVINGEEHCVIRSGNVLEDVKNNWKYISEWLHRVDVYLNNLELEKIMDGRGSSLLRLFYQLFLHLDKRDRTNFIKRENKMVSDLVEKMGHRFKVDKVIEEEESVVDNLSKSLLDEKHFIEWQRKKSKQVKDTYDYIRHKYSKMVKKLEDVNTHPTFTPAKIPKLTPKEQKDMAKFALKYPCKFENYTYDELLSFEKKSLEQRNSISGSDWTKAYMENLHNRLHKKADSEEFQNQLRNDISSTLWDMSIAEEETKFDTELAKKVMKLSQFEKQMCTQIMETKQQARNLFQNRVQAEKEFIEQRDIQFNQFLDNVKEQIHLESVEIDFEKQRQQILHKKLYAEKIKRKRQHYHEICYDTVLSIVDYATKFAYFKKLIGDDIPDHFIHEWKTLYFKQQPVFDILDPLDDLLKESVEEEMQEVEEIIRLELDRQEALNDAEFKEYHNYAYPWTLDLLIPNYDPEADERKYEYLGTRILGHLVYTLLEIKYPFPLSRLPAGLPNYEVKALLRGLPDRALTAPIQILLNARKIHVVRLEHAINYCLRQFKKEMVGCSDIELSFDKFTTVAQSEDDKELIKIMKIDDDSTYKTSDMAVSAMLGVTATNTKQTQTPKSLPEEEITLSDAAELGKYTYESLNAGDTLTDYLLSAMIVEYLKDQPDIKGFVIINYPNSYREAQILEETFLGVAPPDDTDLNDRDDIYLEQSIAKHRKIEKDKHSYVRISKLVDDPHKKSIKKSFESYFTSYIHLRQTDDILQEIFIWDLTIDNSELIDRFYAVMGLNYSLYYEIVEKELLVQICKYIIGDFETPLKSCDLLFGANVVSLLDLPTLEDKRNRSKIIKPEVNNGKSRANLGKSNKFSKSILTTESEVNKDDSLSVEKSIDEEITVPEEEKSILSVEEIKLLAGEEDWDYGELPILEHIGVALANCWEEVEKVYVADMTQLFFAKRWQMNCLVPYARYIKDKMEQIITSPSNKQDYVSRFQKDYNNFENDWRDVNLAKNEWHCRVKEMQDKLYNICDERKKNAEQQRRLLICDNWVMEELTNMANIYISCMQTELNRSIMTFQALHDFYFSMIKRMPSNERLTSKDLIKISRDSDETSGSKKGGEDKVYRQLKNAYQEFQLKGIEIDYSNNPFNFIIENNVKFAIKVIKDTNDSYRSLIAREYGELAKIIPSIKKKDDSSQELINAEEFFKQNALKCIEEWTMGINGEMFRANLRLLALQYKCYRDMKLFNDHIHKAFMEIQNDINTYYLNEIKSVDRLCKYLQMAVENGRRIPESLVLEQDRFVIDPNLLQYALSEPQTDSGDLIEITGDMDFKISQLAALRSQLKIVAPTGIILQQAFIYLLQDFIFFGKETCQGPLFPEAWKSINPEEVSKLVFSLFGDTVYVDWRDFLILCLNIRFPTIDELLEVRKKLRCKDLQSSELIDRNGFIEENLWYEADSDSEDKNTRLRKNLIKHFIFELFETEKDKMNYSAFLLAFCKSNDPIEGFATSLSMSIGKKTCYILDKCEEVICKLIKDKKYRDSCLTCALKCAGQFLDILIAKVINHCEGITITELKYIPPLPEEKKGKKGKGVSKSHSSKKLDTSQSARLPKITKSTNTVKSKLTQSASNVKTTYICPPCEVEVEEKDEKEEEKVEEEHSETEEDPNLAYTVSQSVIWNVLQICLPWHFVLLPEEKMTPYKGQVTELLKRLEQDTDNGDVYVSKFVSDPNICLMLHKVKKFQAVSLAEEIHKIFM